uniref:DUF7876 domain-containing protein n=1 Tax=Nelumbo nucifera TaxID=4432 RepID=A0A822Y3I8_NELNU|nr:TPA_asm: hypothetical protein HUJ06_025651 [Nelumbo nucifera]
MLTMHASRAITKWKTNWETNVLREPSTCNILHINLLINGNHHNQGFYISTSPWKCGGQIKGSSPSNISNLATLKRRLMHVSASSDDEYRSSRNIAVSLFRRYRNVIERGGGVH